MNLVEVKVTLEVMARLWFDRSPLQHAIIVRLIKKQKSLLLPDQGNSRSDLN